MPHRGIRPNVTVTAGGRDLTGQGGASWIKIALAIVLPVILASVLVSASARGAEAAVACSKYAATNGSDRASGSSSRPFRTAQRLVDSLKAGQAGCLRGGSYGGRGGNLTITKPSITLRRAPGSKKQATINARVVVQEGAGGVTISNLKLTGYRGFSNVLIRANRTRLIANNITNYHRDKSCVLVASRSAAIATGTVIKSNRIHNCGRIPRTNLSHGIYVSAGRGTSIIGNAIYGNADRGVQLYPDADGTRVQGNRLRGNGQGITIAGAGRQVSSRNTIAGNVIVDSRAGWNVTSNWNQTRMVGTQNVVKNNCVWALKPNSFFGKRGGINTTSGGLRASGNRISAKCA